MTLLDMIREALQVADYEERKYDEYCVENMLLNTMRQSGAPYSFIEEVYYGRNVTVDQTV